MQELLGRGLLSLGGLVSSMVLLVAYRHYEKYPCLETGALVAFAMSGTYGAVTLMVGACLPLRLIYQRPDLIEMMHRSRYLMFDCASVPGVLWLIVLLTHRTSEQMGPVGSATAFLMDGQARVLVLGALVVVHAVASGCAAGDCVKYPMTTENSLGVVYWRPARFTHKMKRPWVYATTVLWVFATYRFAMSGSVWLLLASVAFRLAFHGHMSQWRFWPWEIFLQAPAAAVLTATLLLARDVTVQCSTRSFDPFSCLVVSPGSAVPLFARPGGMRF